MAVSSLQEAIAGGALVAVLGASWVGLGWGAARHQRLEWKARRRAGRVEAIATEVALGDDAFAPTMIRGVVSEILRAANAQVAGAEQRPDADLIAVWAQQHRVGPTRAVDEGVRSDLLQVVNRGDRDALVILRVRGRIVDRGSRSRSRPASIHFDERWTLQRGDGGWRLVEFDTHPLADAVIDAPVIDDPWADRARLREESLNELAAADAVAAAPAMLVDRNHDAATQLRDLSLVDGRYAPALIEAALEHLVDSWQQATFGAAEPLALRVTEPVLASLLHPVVGQPALRLVLRDTRLRSWRPVAIAPSDVRPQLVIALVISAVRYLTDEAQARRIGSVDYAHDIALTWTLALTDRPDMPWRLVATTSPANDIPGPI